MIGIALLAVSLVSLAAMIYAWGWRPVQADIKREKTAAAAKHEIDDLYSQANRQMRKALRDWLDQR